MEEGRAGGEPGCRRFLTHRRGAQSGFLNVPPASFLTSSPHPDGSFDSNAFSILPVNALVQDTIPG